MVPKTLQERVDVLENKVVSEAFVFKKHTHVEYEPRIIIQHVIASEPSISLRMPLQPYREIPLLPKNLLLYHALLDVDLHRIGDQLIETINKQHLHNKYLREDIDGDSVMLQVIAENTPEQLPDYKTELTQFHETLQERVLAHRLLMSTVEYAHEILETHRAPKLLDEIYSELGIQTYKSFLDADKNLECSQTLLETYQFATPTNISNLSTQATTALRKILRASTYAYQREDNL